MIVIVFTGGTISMRHDSALGGAVPALSGRDILARSSATEKPIVFTGAMRAASELGWDGPANLIAAVRTAASSDACGQGVLVVMGERIFAGADVTQSHSHMLDAFESPGLGPLG